MDKASSIEKRLGELSIPRNVLVAEPVPEKLVCYFDRAVGEGEGDSIVAGDVRRYKKDSDIADVAYASRGVRTLVPTWVIEKRAETLDKVAELVVFAENSKLQQLLGCFFDNFPDRVAFYDSAPQLYNELERYRFAVSNLLSGDSGIIIRAEQPVSSYKMDVGGGTVLLASPEHVGWMPIRDNVRVDVDREGWITYKEEIGMILHTKEGLLLGLDIQSERR